MQQDAACCSVCDQDYTKTTQHISITLGGTMSLSPEQTSLSGADPDKDIRCCFVTLLNIV